MAETGYDLLSGNLARIHYYDQIAKSGYLLLLNQHVFKYKNLYLVKIKIGVIPKTANKKVYGNHIGR